jgi:hypothetical protein
MRVWITIAGINNWDLFLSFNLSSLRKSRKLISEQCICEIFVIIVFWCIGNLVNEFHSYTCNICLTLLIIKNTINFSLLSWHIAIFLEITLNLTDTFIKTTARFYMSKHLLLLIFNNSCLTHNNLCVMLNQPSSWIKSSNKYSHLIFYSALAFSVCAFVLALRYVLLWMMLDNSLLFCR